MELLNTIFASEAFIGGVLAIVGALLTAIANKAANTFERKTGIQVEEKHMRAFHEAIITGVESAMRHGISDAGSTLRAHVMAHLKESVPEALTRLTPGDGVIDRLIERYTLEAINKIAVEPK